MDFSDCVYDKTKHCAVCKGRGAVKLGIEPERSFLPCPFCNGTGEHNKLAERYYQSHVCQCDKGDRHNCVLCGVKCHHDTPNKPKILLMP